MTVRLEMDWRQMPSRHGESAGFFSIATWHPFAMCWWAQVSPGCVTEVVPNRMGPVADWKVHDESGITTHARSGHGHVMGPTS